MHARGYGAHGFFETYESLADITRADLFQRAGERTPAFVRFSTVAGSKGSSDLARDVRGFAVKLYTQEGNWDLVGNNIPVFFIQDADQVPRPHPRREAGARPRVPAGAVGARQLLGLRVADAGVDPHADVGRCPTGRSPGRSGSWRASASTRSGFVNAAGESTFVKFHWKPKQGMQSVLWDEAVKINGADPDFHRRDLWDAITSGDFPEWELGVQVFDDAFADSFEFDVLDPTKLIPEEVLPVRPIGRLVLDRMVDNFFAETEQVAFCTQNIVPGRRLHQRPAAPGPQLLVPRHAAQAARRPELHPPPDQRAEVPDRPLPAGRPHGDDQPRRAGELRAELVHRRRARATRGSRRRVPVVPAAEGGRRSDACGPRASPTTTARPASSSAARRRSSSSTSSTPSRSS